MRRLLALFLLALVACNPAGAETMGKRRAPTGASAPIGPADAGFDIFAQYSSAAGQPDWTFEINGNAFPDPASASAGVPYSINGADAGPLTWSQGSDGGTYAIGQSTGGLTSGGLGAAFINQAVVVNGSSSCWTLATSLLPAVPNGEDIWCRTLFATGDNTTTRILFSWGNAANDLFSNAQISTERNLWGMRTGGLTILNAQSAVLSQGTTTNFHMSDLLYRGANPTNPSMDEFVDGTATLGAEHSVNLGGMVASQRITIGGTTAGQCTSVGIDNRYTYVRTACKIGNSAIGGVTVNEALHDADCTRVGVCP